jgi:hypothetical protein
MTRSIVRPRHLCIRSLSIIIAVGFVLVASPAWAQKTDIVTLVNGDTLTCEIKLLDRGQLQVSTDHLGTVYIEWDKVASITAARTFQVETVDGRILLGQLLTPQPGQIEVLEARGPTAVDHLSIVHIAPIARGFWSKLDGSLDLGWSYTQSSGVAQASFSATASYRRPRWLLTASASTYLTRQEEADDTSRSTVQVTTTRSLFTRSLWLVQGTAMRNEELGYHFRGTAGAGIGHFLHRSNRGALVVGGGLATSTEVPLEGDTTQTLDGLLVVRHSFFTYDSPKTDLSTSFAVYPGLSQWGRVRTELDGTYKREIVKDFTVGLSVYDSYDNRPPTADARKNDVGFSLTVGWTF